MKLKDLKNVKFVIINNLVAQNGDIKGDYVDYTTESLTEALFRMEECKKYGGVWNVEFGDGNSVFAEALEDWDFKKAACVCYCGGK